MAHATALANHSSAILGGCLRHYLPYDAAIAPPIIYADALDSYGRKTCADLA